MTPQDLAFLLRSAREAKGLSQETLSDAAGCTQGTISAWERGKGWKQFTKAVRAFHALGVTVYIAGPANLNPKKAEND